MQGGTREGEIDIYGKLQPREAFEVVLRIGYAHVATTSSLCLPMTFIFSYVCNLLSVYFRHV